MLVNSKPLLYLGRDKVTGSYYFLSSKEGEGRFLKYLKYPYWCLASQLGNLLDLNAVLPDEVMQEVISFAQGKIRYDIIPKKQGRAERIVRQEVPQAIVYEVPVTEVQTSHQTKFKGVTAPPAGDATSQDTRPTSEAPATPKRRGRPPKQLAQTHMAGSEQRTDNSSGSGSTVEPSGRRLPISPDILGESGAGSKRDGSSVRSGLKNKV